MEGLLDGTPPGPAFAYELQLTVLSVSCWWRALLQRQTRREAGTQSL